MKTLAEFTKTTLVGGVLIVLPIYVSILLLLKAISGLIALVNPITAGIPAEGNMATKPNAQALRRILDGPVP